MNTAVISGRPLSSQGSRSESAPAHWLARAAGAVWRALEASGQARAQAHLRAFADQCEANQPELAKELRAAIASCDAA